MNILAEKVGFEPIRDFEKTLIIQGSAAFQSCMNKGYFAIRCNFLALLGAPEPFKIFVHDRVNGGAFRV